MKKMVNSRGLYKYLMRVGHNVAYNNLNVACDSRTTNLIMQHNKCNNVHKKSRYTVKVG